MIFTYFLLFILGLVTGSFLNVIIYREIADQKKSKYLPSWLTGRSYCDHCRKKISWYDNIPLVSYLVLGGMCRYCHKKISRQYPLVELLTAFEFIWLYWLLGRFSFFGRLEGFYSASLLLYWLFMFSSLLVIFLVDAKIGIIPDWVIIPGIIISSLRLIESGRWQFFLAGLAAGVFFLTLYLITSAKGLGFGDVKLGFLMGLFLGYPAILVAILLAFLTGAFFSVMLILSGKKHWGQTIAFGPFLVVGTIIAKLWGIYMWQWYVSLLI